VNQPWYESLPCVGAEAGEDRGASEAEPKRVAVDAGDRRDHLRGVGEGNRGHRGPGELAAAQRLRAEALDADPVRAALQLAGR
jgi:hypothetical protein